MVVERGHPMRFCPQCGTRLAEGGRFCSGCGQPLAAAAAAAATAAPLASATAASASARRPLRDQAPGLVVLTLFLAAGLAIWLRVLQPSARTGSAPTSPSPPEAGGMPADHPPLALPDEAKQFVASLATKADAAPSDVGAWKTLAQVQARAAEIDPSYRAQAVESYRHVLGLAPDDLEAMQGLGNVYYDQQQYAAAAQQYEDYLKVKPDDPNVRTDLGTTYLYQRQIDRAIDTYASVLKAHPDFMQAYFNLGLAYEAKGDRTKAAEALAKARSLAPDDATRAQIDRVSGQLEGKAGAHGGLDAIAEAGTPDGAPPATAAGAARPTPPSTGAAASDFKGAVEAGLRAHPILGPKITAIDWPEPTHARVRVANFPMQAMPDFARNLFRARLETILDDAKTKHGVTGECTIELVDTASGTAMETVTH
jgi:tetratricopeptide (TPR) repeat protein